MKKLLFIPILALSFNLHGADFNKDGRADFLLFKEATRQTMIWYMNNNNLVGTHSGPTLPVGWSLVGAADFNHDGYPDYLLYNFATRKTRIWYMHDYTHVSGAFGPVIPQGFSIDAIGDFNHDGYADILLEKDDTRDISILYMRNNHLIQNKQLNWHVNPGFNLLFGADFDGDGWNDFVFTHRLADGHTRTVVEFQKNGALLSYKYSYTLPVGFTLFDVAKYDGNNFPDYAIDPAGIVKVVTLANSPPPSATIIATHELNAPTLNEGWEAAKDVWEAAKKAHKSGATCNVVINPAGFNLNSYLPLPYPGQIQVMTGTPTCTWTKASTVYSWIHILNAGSGEGPSTVSFNVEQNGTGGLRTGFIIVAGKTCPISQPGDTFTGLAGTWNGTGQGYACGAYRTFNIQFVIDSNASHFTGHVYMTNLPCFNGDCTAQTVYNENAPMTGDFTAGVIVARGRA